jgi:hypothetical protein
VGRNTEIEVTLNPTVVEDEWFIEQPTDRFAHSPGSWRSGLAERPIVTVCKRHRRYLERAADRVLRTAGLIIRSLDVE